MIQKNMITMQINLVLFSNYMIWIDIDDSTEPEPSCLWRKGHMAGFGFKDLLPLVV